MSSIGNVSVFTEHTHSHFNNDEDKHSAIFDPSSPEYLSWRRLHLAKSKLRNVTEMASFMAGFAVVACVELQINDDLSVEDDNVNPILLTAFAVTTALLVATSMVAIMISTCILPHIQAVVKLSLISQVSQSPHDSMAHLIDLSWVLANTASLFFFTLDVILMCWIKFTVFSYEASIAATCIMSPVLVVILAFGVIFYRKVTKHQYIISTLKVQEVERLKQQLERDSVIYAMSVSNFASPPPSLPVSPSGQSHVSFQFPPSVIYPHSNSSHHHTFHGTTSTTTNNGYTSQSHSHQNNNNYHTVNVPSVEYISTRNPRIRVLQKQDSTISLRSRLSISDSEGSFSKESRSRGSIFIV